MLKRLFGKTDILVSPIAFGCGRVGGLLVNGERADQEKAFGTAIDHGINWFDTAEIYGSEETLGNLLSANKADVHVSTKITLDPQSTDLAGDLEKQADESLRRLRRDHVTVLQVHNRIGDNVSGNALSVEQMTGDIVAGLSRLRDKGKTRLIGITALGDTHSVVRVIDSGAFESAQIYYNAINPSAARTMPPGWSGQSFDGVLAAAERHGMGTLGIRVLDGGIIATDIRPRPVSMMAQQTSEEIEQHKAQNLLAGLRQDYPDIIEDRALFGLRFALSCSGLSTALVGIGAPIHVNTAIEAARLGPLPKDVLERIDALYSDDFRIA